jgi:Na+-translocating ferredoxin:NAD+ oxidoreductase subunit D
MLKSDKRYASKDRSKRTTRGIMLDVLVSLLPATAVGVYWYRGQAVAIILASILASVITEAIWQKVCGKNISISDFSAVVTGLILSLILPIHVPIWIPIAGSIFATLIVKQFFGGVGNNFMNPAAAAKVFLMTSWTAVMIKPAADSATSASNAAEVAETVSAASEAIGAVSYNIGAVSYNLSDFWHMFLSQNSGNIGEASVAAIFIGGIYLIVRKVISYRIPLTFIISNAIIVWLLGGKNGLFSGDVVNSLLSSVLFMAAIFMANDPSSTPRNKKSQVLFGVVCGVLAAIFKIYGYNNEGAYYAVLVANMFAPLIEKSFTNNVNAGVPKEAL